MKKRNIVTAGALVLILGITAAACGNRSLQTKTADGRIAGERSLTTQPDAGKTDEETAKEEAQEEIKVADGMAEAAVEEQKQPEGEQKQAEQIKQPEPEAATVKAEPTGKQPEAQPAVARAQNLQSQKLSAPAQKPQSQKPSAPAQKPQSQKPSAPAQKPQSQKPSAPAQKPQSPKPSAPVQKPQSKPSHTHSWVKQTKEVRHEAVGHNEQVLVKAAWTEKVPVYETKAIEVCNTCGADITKNRTAHLKEHALKGEGGSCRTEYKQIQTGTKTVEHSAQYTTKWVQDKAAWTETVVTGYRCSCGAVK